MQQAKTTQEKIQKIREECIKVNPEIVELKFGCKVVYVNLSNVQTDKPDDDIDYDELNWDKDDECDYTIIDEDIISNNQKIPVIHRLGVFDAKVVTEIIGRDIRLADVLYMFKKNADDYYTEHNSSTKIVEYLDYIQKDVVNRFNLLDDNLEHQSEECIDFIYQLIK